MFWLGEHLTGNGEGEEEMGDIYVVEERVERQVVEERVTDVVVEGVER